MHLRSTENEVFLPGQLRPSGYGSRGQGCITAAMETEYQRFLALAVLTLEYNSSYSGIA